MIAYTFRWKLTRLCHCERSEAQIAVHGQDFAIAFNRATGRMASWQYQGDDLVHQGPSLNIWRAPTDNDANDWGDQRAAIRWREVGLDRLAESVMGVEVSQTSPQAVQIQVRATSSAEIDASAVGAKRWADMLSGLGHGLAHFANQETLQALCQQLGASYADLEGDDVQATANALIAELDRQDRIPELLGRSISG